MFSSSKGVNDVDVGVDNAGARPISRRAEMSSEQVEEIREAFELFDSDGTGAIEKHKLKLVLKALGHEPPRQQIHRILREAGVSARTTRISYGEFERFMMQLINENEINEEMMKAFKLFDVDNTGKITLANLRQVAQLLGEKLTEEELREMIEEADLDKDGAVNANEFTRIMKRTDLWQSPTPGPRMPRPDENNV